MCKCMRNQQKPILSLGLGTKILEGRKQQPKDTKKKRIRFPVLEQEHGNAGMAAIRHPAKNWEREGPVFIFPRSY